MGKKSRGKRQREVVDEESRSAVHWTPIISAALFLSVVVVYAQLAGHDFVNVDDSVHVTQNGLVTSGLSMTNVQRAFTSYKAAYWLPLTWISYMVDVQLFGLRAGKMLMTNLLLHALNSVLLFLFLRRTTEAVWRSAIVAALFALHPLHVESVAWVTERKDVLSTFFFMLALHAYIAFLRKRSVPRYALIMAAFACGLMAKPMVVTLPFVLLLLDWWPLQRFSLQEPGKLKPLIVEKLALFAVIIPGALITLHAQQPAIAALPLSQRVANALTSYVAYLGKMLWPAHLAVIYPLRSISNSMAFGALFLLAAVTGAALWFGRSRPWLPVGWFWYLGTLVPVIGIVQAGRQSMADRFTYIPLIGIFMALVWAAAELRPIRPLAPAAAAVVLVACGAMSYLQAGYWRDSITLERHAVEVTRNNDEAHVYLGSAYAQHGDHDAAEREYKAALAINPQNDEAYRKLGRINLSTRPQEAVPLLEKALSLKRDSATEAMLAAARGDKQRAADLFQRALGEGDDTADLHNDYAAVLAIIGRDQDALEQYHQALARMPDHYDAHMNLGALLSRLGRDAEAAEQFAAAANVRPDSPEPHVYLALAYANSGRIDSAIGEVNRAMAINPAQSNVDFTNAVRMPYKDSNIAEYLAFLRSRSRG